MNSDSLATNRIAFSAFSPRAILGPAIVFFFIPTICRPRRLVSLRTLTTRRARREFDVIQRFQKSPYLPSLVDSWQALPNYAGEIFFFSVSDSAAVPTSVLKENRDWTLSQRRDFAKRALIALAEFSEPSEGALLHRALDAESVRVRADNTPLFAGWRWARLTTAQTLSAGQTGDNLGPFAAPEVRSNGLAAATPSSDLFSLCAVLVELFSAEEVPDVREILLLGCDPDPSRRPGARDIVDLLKNPNPLHCHPSGRKQFRQ